jgi:hypothetical protein
VGAATQGEGRGARARPAQGGVRDRSLFERRTPERVGQRRSNRPPLATPIAIGSRLRLAAERYRLVPIAGGGDGGASRVDLSRSHGPDDLGPAPCAQVQTRDVLDA